MPSNPSREQEEVVWIRELANGLSQRGLIMPAIVFLEVCRPIAFIGSQLLLLLDPLLSPLGGLYDRRYVRLLEDPQHLNMLLEMLENQHHRPAA